MNSKLEKVLLLVVTIVILLCLFLQYIIGVDNFSDPVMAKYVIEVVLYPCGLVALILVWRQTLDKKISSKKEREKRFKEAKDNE
jgi:uncharacterized membrane protein